MSVPDGSLLHELLCLKRAYEDRFGNSPTMFYCNTGVLDSLVKELRKQVPSMGRPHPWASLAVAGMRYSGRNQATGNFSVAAVERIP